MYLWLYLVRKSKIKKDLRTLNLLASKQKKPKKNLNPKTTTNQVANKMIPNDSSSSHLHIPQTKYNKTKIKNA